MFVGKKDAFIYPVIILRILGFNLAPHLGCEKYIIPGSKTAPPISQDLPLIPPYRILALLFTAFWVLWKSLEFLILSLEKLSISWGLKKTSNNCIACQIVELSITSFTSVGSAEGGFTAWNLIFRHQKPTWTWPQWISVGGIFTN